jgi:hypothetical protein
MGTLLRTGPTTRPMRCYWKKLFVAVPSTFPFWYVSDKELYISLIRATSAAHLVRSAASGRVATRSVMERAVKNLLVRLYSGRSASVCAVSVGDATWKTDWRMSMSSIYQGVRNVILREKKKGGGPGVGGFGSFRTRNTGIFSDILVGAQLGRETIPEDDV